MNRRQLPPGVTFRPLRLPDDLPALVELVMDTRAADGVERVTTVERSARDYAARPAFDPHSDALAAQLDGRIVAVGRTWWFDGSAGVRLHETFCAVHPNVRRQGIGAALLRANERRVRELAGAQPTERQRLLSATVPETDDGARSLLTAEGYLPVHRYDDMVRPNLDDLVDTPLPDGLVVRPVEPAHLRPIWDTNEVAYRDTPGEVDWSDAAFTRFVQDARTDPRHWQVAWDGDQVAGLVMTMIDPEENAAIGHQRGWLWSVAVRAPRRARGVARALIVRSLGSLRAAGMTAAGLDVHVDNPTGAPHLYQSLGFRVTTTSVTYRKAVAR